MTEYTTPAEIAEQLGISVRTVHRWRTEGKIVEGARGTEVIYLASLNTSSGGRGRVLIPVSHEQSLGGGRRILGKTEFIAALPWSDPVLRRAAVELFL